MKGATELPAPLRVGPRSSERPADAGATLVAGIEGRSPARVDGAGLVTPGLSQRPGGLRSWSVDWWIGADDRWHVPAREPAVRQRRIGAGPVIETSLRVPSGDVLHTAYPVVLADRTVTVIEIRNESPVPVALALAIRPYSASGATADATTGGHRLQLGEAPVIEVDGVAMVRLPRQPNEAGAMADVDLLDEVEAGRDLSWPDHVVGRSANAVCLYPLPHRTALRFVVESGAATGAENWDLARLDPETLPDADSAARGWTAVLERAARFEFPDPGISELAAAARARLVMAAPDLIPSLLDGDPGAGATLHGLAIGGHQLECREPLLSFAGSFPTGYRGSADDAAEVVHGVAIAAELLADRELGETLLTPATQLTGLVDRAGGRRGERAAGRRARAGLARLAVVVGQNEAAADLMSDVDERPVADIDRLMAMAERAAPSRAWSADDEPGSDRGWDSPAAAAEFWIAARRFLLDESRTGDGRPVIELLPNFPTAWRGGTVEVHRAPILGYRVSFAIRWHGYRPALLWDVEVDGNAEPNAATGGELPLITCPGLDGNWQAEEAKGEALLAGSADDLPDAPEPGDSFQ